MTSTYRFFKTTFLSLLMAAGCSSSSSPGSPTGGDSGTTPDASVSEASPVGDWDGAVPDLTGTWALLEVQAGITNAPGVGTTETLTQAISRAEVVQTGLNVDVQSTHCSIDVSTGTTLATTIIPDAFIQALGQLSRVSVLEKTAAGYTFKQRKTISLRGAKLTNAETDPLPTSPTESTVYDQDGDNKPGMTIRVGGLLTGEMYVAQRDWSIFEAPLTSASKIRGSNTWGVEQTLLGKEKGLELITSAPAPTPDPDKSKSYFVLARIESASDCKAILAAKKDLFGL